MLKTIKGYAEKGYIYSVTGEIYFTSPLLNYSNRKYGYFQYDPICGSYIRVMRVVFVDKFEDELLTASTPKITLMLKNR